MFAMPEGSENPISRAILPAVKGNNEELSKHRQAFSYQQTFQTKTL